MYMDTLEKYFYTDPKYIQKSHTKMIVHQLFKGHLDTVSKAIYPGLHKIKYSSKNILEGFVKSSRKACAELYATL